MVTDHRYALGVYAEQDGIIKFLRGDDWLIPGFLSDLMDEAERLGIPKHEIVDEAGYGMAEHVEKYWKERVEYRKKQNAPKDE
jgi:hypothetical protein